MTKTLKIILASGAAAALALAALFSALDRAERARGESLSWPYIEQLALSGGYKKAAAFLDERLQKHPNDALLYYYRARLGYTVSDGAAALADADRAIKLGYAQEISHLLKALVHGRIYGDYKAQAELASKALSFDPTYDEGYLVRAEARYALGDYKACVKDAASFSRMAPKAADGWEYGLLCLAELGDYDGAEAAGLKVLELKPKSHAAQWRLGRLYAARGLHKRAIKRFSEALRLSGGRAEYYLDRARSCEAEGDFSCAAWDYASATAWPEVSDYTSYYYLLGSAMHRVGEFKAGLDAAETAVSRAPLDPDAYALRGRLRADLGDLAGAKKDFQKLGALAPARAAEAEAWLKKLKPGK
jgi:tetratricopeptide (TPR) repeat protein